MPDTYSTAQFAIDPLGAQSAQRTWKQRYSEILDVRDFAGVVGDGSHNDTAGIQACFDAAFGSAASPHGGSLGQTGTGGQFQNKAVYFPVGNYQVNARVGQSSITAVSQNAGGTFRYTTSAAHGLLTNDTVYIYGITAAGSNALNSTGTGDFNGTRRITVVDATHFDTQTKPDYTTNAGLSFTNAKVTLPCLTLTNVLGGVIFGSGSYSTSIRTSDSNGITILANGMQNTKISELSLYSNGSEGIGFLSDLDGDSTHSNGFSANTTNTFDHIAFQNYPSGGTAFNALSIGDTNYSTADSHQIRNCFFQGTLISGVRVGRFGNPSSIGHQYLGCNSISVTNPIHVVYGCVAFVGGSIFEVSSDYDILVDRAVNNETMVINGVRTESANFAKITGQAVTFVGCTMGNTGYFANCTGPVVILACQESVSAKNHFGPYGATVLNSFFHAGGTASWLDNTTACKVYTRNCQIGNTIDRPSGVWICDGGGGTPLYTESGVVALTKSGAPVAGTDVAAGTFAFVWDTSVPEARVWYNNAGVMMKSPAFT